MKLQRTTIILLVSVLLLGTVVSLSEIQRAEKQEETKDTKQNIFSFKEDQIQSVTLYLGEETLEFERVDRPVNNWQMKQPKDIPANNASVAFLLDLLAEGKSDRSFEIPLTQDKLQEYGLDQPQASIKVQLKNQESHWLTLGKPDFNRSFLYAQVDPSYRTAKDLKVHLVPIDFEYAVNRPMSEWQSEVEKPEIPTPSPTSEQPKASPTAGTAKPSPTPAATPKASPTAGTTKPSPTPAATPKPSPTAGTAKPSPTPAATPKPSPAAGTAKPSPTPAATPKPSPTTGT
ncbi:MAG: DUF4340 domain-containing protein, partial [Cyanobacteriota bacterium]